MYYIINTNVSCDEPNQITKIKTEKELESTILELTSRKKMAFTIIHGEELSYNLRHSVEFSKKEDK